jgi:hypothetical protein
VLPVEDGVTIETDRQILAAVVGNLLQNTFKSTRPQTSEACDLCRLSVRLMGITQ